MSHKTGMDLPDLPITAALTGLLDALGAARKAVLQAPPGAGKTTLVPLALMQAGLVRGRIVMLEPRRLAARAAAERMAELLGEKVGGRVGFRIRGEAKVSRDTVIEVVTEGILTRMLQSDPALPGIGAVIFDEFHERSLNADLGLALTVEAQAALREDLVLLVMSATLDAAPVAKMIGAPVVTSEGRAFPVETIWQDRPAAAGAPLGAGIAVLVSRALEETEGGVLVFLPGEREIRDTARALGPQLGSDCDILPLYGALPFAQQRRAIAPGPKGRRKVVLATAIAETSLTIEDIRVVVDAGLARRARFDPGSGMQRLVTEKVSRAEADQRRGRAGRVAPGWCYRYWPQAAEGALAAFAPPEIETGDLAGLALELAAWGTNPAELAFLTPPPEGALAAARGLLAGLGALDAAGRITEHGRAMAALPLHPRLAHMLIRAGSGAALLAALLSDRDPAPGTGVDLAARRRAAAEDARIGVEAKRLARLAGPDQGLSLGAQAALAYPDRIGLRRPGGPARFLLSGGRGAVMDDAAALAGERLIVVTDLNGGGREARIRRAAALGEAELRDLYSGDIGWTQDCQWSRRDRRIVAREQERFGAIVLSERAWRDVPQEALASAALDGFRDLGLGWTGAARLFAARVGHLRRAGHDLPDMGEAALLDRLEDWLLPVLHPVPRNAAEIAGFDILPGLRAMLDYQQTAELDRLAPARFHTPTGRDVVIDYSGEAPEIAVRLQELFGVTAHPIVAGQPLRITLLSPAARPIQVTQDLPGFWQTNYADLRKDMRGRYPKHPWPEDPANAQPTTRAKPRKA